MALRLIRGYEKRSNCTVFETSYNKNGNITTHAGYGVVYEIAYYNNFPIGIKIYDNETKNLTLTEFEYNGENEICMTKTRSGKYNKFKKKPPVQRMAYVSRKENIIYIKDNDNGITSIIFDEKQRPISIKLSGNDFISIEYNQHGVKEYKNVIAKYTEKYNYDNLGRLINKSNIYENDNILDTEYEFVYFGLSQFPMYKIIKSDKLKKLKEIYYDYIDIPDAEESPVEFINNMPLEIFNLLMF